MNSYSARSDAELALLAREGDQSAFACLFGRYNSMIYAKASEKSRICGTDITDDMAQEAAIGFLNAVRNYDPSKGAGFRTYSERCVDNVLTSAVRSYFSEKNMIITNHAQLDCSGEEEMVFPDNQHEADDSGIDGGYQSSILSGLSELERSVVEMRVRGLSYEETANALGISVKSVDNAIQRVRQKYNASKRR